MSVKEQFDSISKQYDQQRRGLIPCFDDFYRLPSEVLDFQGTTPNILDIGCGTGLFSSVLLKKYPNAKFTLIDLSDKMLELAKERFKNNINFKFITEDYTKHKFNEKFDIIISALSIHHLSATQKEVLYDSCYKMLNDNGIFINADQVLSPYPEVESMFSNLWKKEVEQSGLEPEEIKKAYQRLTLDNPSTLSDQLLWLKKAGFKYSDVLFKYYHFCVLYAKK
ncbi:class I SAM-dependent methyltransferase [Desulfovibrio litoralis]|uniref:tRNA (Cmo5U34)-methyltransferase n=1 Tax=Desulfovibrio litoralis DSM 11393 TaxID=1121455 RepID=A0A1M7SBY8_9BACT|nr:class I SAM-dependent methyltransferase [Desulfovibrio litoralis]SHN56019.1 tRNA (cmo5U34)-methyltransferase [Desulfovibrio litoralis DSM 11393]